MLIDISELFPFEEKTREYEVSFEADLADGIEVERSEGFVLTVTHHRDHKLDLSGAGSIVLMFPCDRCLKPVPCTVDFSIDRSVDAVNRTDEDGEEVFFIEGSLLNVDELMMDDIRMNLPMKVLCKEDCKGICKRCGANLNDGSCSCEAEERPTRMGLALQKAFEDAMKKK